jgi:hypothetical protein
MRLKEFVPALGEHNPYGSTVFVRSLPSHDLFSFQFIHERRYGAHRHVQVIRNLPHDARLSLANEINEFDLLQAKIAVQTGRGGRLEMVN